MVDEGSTGDTAERVQYFYKAHRGQASAFNVGLRAAQGEIVAMLDADDYRLPGKLGACRGNLRSIQRRGWSITCCRNST